MKVTINAITGLDFIDQERILVSMAATSLSDSTDSNQSEILVRSIFDCSRPRIVLEPRLFSKAYLCDGAIICSHEGGRSLWKSAIGQVQDAIYKVPKAYVHGTMPGFNPRAILYIFAFSQCYKKDSLKQLLHSSDLQTFEEPVRNAIQLHLQNKLQKCKSKAQTRTLRAIEQKE